MVPIPSLRILSDLFEKVSLRGVILVAHGPPLRTSEKSLQTSIWGSDIDAFSTVHRVLVRNNAPHDHNVCPSPNRHFLTSY